MDARKISRRGLLQAGAAALVSSTAAAGLLQRIASAQSVPAALQRPRALVCLFQRGAVDALSMIVPHADPAYHRARPHIAIARPGAPGGAIDLDGRFGLHPRLAPLEALYRAGSLAIVHAVGSPDATRSHFDAQHLMEVGASGDAAARARTGFLDRCLECLPGRGAFRGVALGPQRPEMLAGPAATLVLDDLRTFGLRAGPPPERARIEQAFGAMYANETDGLGRAGREALGAIGTARAVAAANRLPEHGAVYPPGATGRALAQLAQLIKADLGLTVASVDVGGWDTHVGQGDGTQGRLYGLFDELARALRAFHDDLGERVRDVVLITMSEFGRTVDENGTAGTDHGHGTAMLVMGGEVQGGRVHGRWPGLDRADRFEGRDLAVTTDCRAVFGEVITRHLAVRDLATVFPGFDAAAAAPLGLFASAPG